MGNEAIQDTPFFNGKREKQGKTGKKTGEKTLKNRKKLEKTGKKKQKITRNTETRF